MIALDFNGSARGIPRVAGYGYQVREDAGEVLASGQGIVLCSRPTAFVGIIAGLVAGLQWLLALAASGRDLPAEVVAGTACDIVPLQVMGRMGAHIPDQRVLLAQARRAIDELQRRGCAVTVTQVTRAEVHDALELARAAIDAADVPADSGALDGVELVPVALDEAGEVDEAPAAWQLAEQDVAEALGGTWQDAVGRYQPDIVAGWLVANVRHRRRPRWILETVAQIHRQAGPRRLGVVVLQEDEGEPPVVVMALADCNAWFGGAYPSHSDNGALDAGEAAPAESQPGFPSLGAERP